MRKALTVTAALLFLACGGDDKSPTGTGGPAIPNVRGSYSGAWTLDLVVTATGQTDAISATGSITVSSQSGGGFSGSFIIREGGSTTTGSISGTIRADGGLNFSISVPGGNPNEFADLTGCAVISGDSGFAGLLSGNRVTADASFIADCVISNVAVRTRWTIAFDGNR